MEETYLTQKFLKITFKRIGHAQFQHLNKYLFQFPLNFFDCHVCQNKLLNFNLYDKVLKQQKKILKTLNYEDRLELLCS